MRRLKPKPESLAARNPELLERLAIAMRFFVNCAVGAMFEEWRRRWSC